MDKNKLEENIYIEPFIRFYIPQYFPSIKAIDIDYPDDNRIFQMPDYYLDQPKMVVEIKRVLEKADIERSASWYLNVKKLEKKLEQTELVAIPKGLYLIDLPLTFKVKKGKEGKIITPILKGIENNKTQMFINGIGDIKINKYSGDAKKIIFSSTPISRFINPPAIIHENIAGKIKTANNQLDALRGVEVHKRILLLVNEYMFGKIEQYFEALSYSYKELLTYQNIDEIWLQIKTGTTHILLYSRNFLISYDNNKPAVDEASTLLFEKWFVSLIALGDENKEKLFTALKCFIGNKKPCHVFSNSDARTSMIRLGDWLAEEKRYDDLFWLIDKFMDDPDPGFPEEYQGIPDFNYHVQIVKGKEDFEITTVLGTLAWAIQKLALQQDYISKALKYVIKLLSHKNLYVKLQALYPLLEIARRRQWLNGWGERPLKGAYSKFHNLVFDLVTLVKNNSNYRAIAKLLCNIFSYYKDLSTEEAEKVLEALITYEDAGALFIYFGVYRQNHYSDHPVEFNGERFRRKLESIISDTSAQNLKIRENIAWHFWKIVNENPGEFLKIKPFIDIFLHRNYRGEIYYYIEHIINDCIKLYPEVCISWYELLLKKIKAHFIHKKIVTRPCLWSLQTSVILNGIAKVKPAELLEIIKILIDFKNKGIYSGDLKCLFESFKSVTDNEMKTEIKQELQQIYNSMIKPNQPIEMIDWD